MTSSLMLLTCLLGISLISIILYIWLARRQFLTIITDQLTHLGNFDSARVSDIPPDLIQNFAHRSCSQDPSRPNRIRIHQVGEMRQSDKKNWIPFTATQDFAIGQPAFIWQADFYISPFIWITVVDSYLQGKGFLEARLWGAIPIAKAEGTDIDKSELMRYLAEIAFCPDALLHNASLHWSQEGNNIIKVFVGEDNGQAAVYWHFDQHGNLIKIDAPDRPRMVDKRVEATPWVGTFSDYKPWHGYHLPTVAEVSWVLNKGVFPYWRGRMTQLEINPLLDLNPRRPGHRKSTLGSLKQPKPN